MGKCQKNKLIVDGNVVLYIVCQEKGGEKMLSNINYSVIQDAAIYLRKSRGDIECDLEQHRLILRELCKKLGIRSYNEYAEIGTSNSIEDRPKFTEMLQDVKRGLFDAVLVIDIDRLGRGNDEDWGKIERILQENEVIIITPEKTYDWENENDGLMLDTKKYLAKIEYRGIVTRFRRGKTARAKLGHWSNGKPPYPYLYDRETRTIVVDENKRKVYRYMVEKALEGYSADEIAWDLNRQGHKSPGGKHWSNVAVYRLLCSEIHLGKIVYGKTRGSGHKNKKTRPLKKLPKSDWIVVDGFHKSLKTQAEHEKILELIAKRKIIPKAARRGAFTLSGLVHCGKCGRSMQFTYNGVSDVEYVKKCQHSDPFGNRCGNRGVNTKVIVDAIFTELKKYEDQIRSTNCSPSNETEMLQNAINNKRNAIIKHQRAMDILQEQREDGEISKERFIERKEVRETNLANLRQEIAELTKRCTLRENMSNAQRLKTIEEVSVQWSKLDSKEEKNRLLKTILDRIDYERNGDDIHIKVHFL